MSDAGDTITDPEALQARVGKLPGPRDLKVIDFLDEHAIRWLAHASFGFAAFADGGTIDITAMGGETGFVHAADPRRLSFAIGALDATGRAREGAGFGSLLLVPGLGETLRVNGRVAAVADGRVSIAVEECYLHCAKALIRSAFWQATPRDEAPPPQAADLRAHARFLALATVDGDGRVDVSPKGDPAGVLLQSRDDGIWYPDRPGNRRVDSFRNILARPRIALLALVPGSTHCLRIDGDARIATDPDALAGFAVDGKVPALATCIRGARLQSFASNALARARLWPLQASPPGIDPAAIFRDHVKLSRSTGLQATLARAGVSVPGLMRKGLDHDYKRNLY